MFHAASRWPSGLKSMRLIHPLPVIGAPTGVPVVTSQSCTVQFLLPVATIGPSGLKAMKFTGASGLIGCPTGRIDLASHSCTVPEVTAAILRPSAL